MPTINLQSKSKESTGLILSAADIKENYLFGVRIEDQDGIPIGDDIFEMYIKAAQDEIEKYLNLKLQRQIFEENLSFRHEEWEHWGFIKTTYPVVCNLSLKGFLGSTKQVEYPLEWITTRKSSEDGLYHRSIYMVPVSSGGQTSNILFSGVIPSLNYYASTDIPFYWNLAYVTGFEKIPADILNVVGKLASINLFHIAGDLILGAGIASQSIGIDGLSQSISTTSSATNSGYGSRILGYQNDLKKQIPLLRDFYRGFNFTSV